MEKTMAVLISSFLGLMSLTIGVVILIRKQFFSYGKTGQFIGKVSGKKAKAAGLNYLVGGLLFLGLATAIYLWGS